MKGMFQAQFLVIAHSKPDEKRILDRTMRYNVSFFRDGTLKCPCNSSTHTCVHRDLVMAHVMLEWPGLYERIQTGGNDVTVAAHAILDYTARIRTLPPGMHARQ